MRLLGVLAAAAIGCLATGPALAAPLEAYGQLPSIEQAAISADGALLAVVMTDGEQRKVVIEDTAAKKIVGGVNAGTERVTDLEWAGSRHLLITVISTNSAPPNVIAPRTEWQMVVDYDMQTGQQRQLLNDVPDAMSIVNGAPQVRVIDGKTYAFLAGVQFLDGTGVISLFADDLDTGHSMVRIEGSLNSEGWLVDAQGQAVAESLYDRKAGAWALQLKGPGGWRVAKTADGKIERPFIVGFDRDGEVLVEAPEEQGETLHAIHPGDADWGAPSPLTAGESLVFDPVTDRLIGTDTLTGDDDEVTFSAFPDQVGWKAALRAFPGARVAPLSESADHRKLVVEADSPAKGPALYLVNLDAKTADFIGAEYDGLAEADIAPVRAVTFKAADGLALNGYLTLPNGKDPRNLPLIVFPHGGPAARDAPGFDWWAQAMAAQGYAVLQVNYRGSDGFGWDFMAAGFGQWGQKMQTDLSDGVRYLAAQGTVDPKRVCIVGASYGGYAALAGATLDPGVYRCAVDVAGPADLKRFVAWRLNRSDDEAEQRYWDRFMGAKNLGDAHLAAISPAEQAAKASIPILIIHGKDDAVVPFEQSQIMADALRRAGKPVELVTLNNEDHYLLHGDTRLQMLRATVDFLEKNNPAN